VVVEFYTKWCKFCKILSPEYDKLAKEYQEKRKDVVISRLEGQANSFTLQRYNIFRFPVIALFKPKSKEMYSIFQNERDFDHLSKWINDACPIINNEKKNENINRANNLLQINNESEMFNITPKLKTEDILIPTEVETYLNVTQNIFYINKIPYSLQTIGKILTIL
jgi:thiol-disulfide isomerase/thioredoxin